MKTLESILNESIFDNNYGIEADVIDLLNNSIDAKSHKLERTFSDGNIHVYKLSGINSNDVKDCFKQFIKDQCKEVNSKDIPQKTWILGEYNGYYKLFHCRIKNVHWGYLMDCVVIQYNINKNNITFGTEKEIHANSKLKYYIINKNITPKILSLFEKYGV